MSGYPSEVDIRPITAADDRAIEEIIRTVMPEYGADGPGFAIHDAEVSAMSSAYARPRAEYRVAVLHGRIVGGGGFAPLEGGDGSVCEIRKMYFAREARGLGIGGALLRELLLRAAGCGYAGAYLETLAAMKEARALYERCGFTPLRAAMGATGHFGCNSFYYLPLG
ncbi:MAG: GNAT family N-acetyltransferase [Myxococcota bacterium]